MNAPIAVSAEQAQRWYQGSYEVWYLRGACRIEQQRMMATGQHAVVWIDRTPGPINAPPTTIVYLEGDVNVRNIGETSATPDTDSPSTLQADRWTTQLFSTLPLQVQAPLQDISPDHPPEIYARATERAFAIKEPSVRPAQFIQGPAPLPGIVPAPHEQQGMGAREIGVFQRYSVKPQIESYVSENTGERVVVYDRGIRIIISDIRGLPGTARQWNSLETVELAADRVVVWTKEQFLTTLGNMKQPENIPLEIYMEGNLVFREGERVIRAQRMFYNIQTKQGVILDANARTPAPALYEGFVRLKADVLQQLDENTFQAYGASLTTSQLGVPQYWMQSENIFFRHEQRTAIDALTGAPIANQFGEQVTDNQYQAISSNNRVYLFGVPVFYWPRISTNLTESFFYINNASIGNDKVFGTQIRTDWNLYQLLGFEDPPDGTEWDLSLDYLSERGFGVGSTLDYEQPIFFTDAGPTRGFLDAWGIDEQGLDNLGRGRRSLTPEESFRGRMRAQHQQYLQNGFRFSYEVGLISDRNFLEQYYEEEWDQEKDQITGFELKRLDGNRSLSFTTDVRLNDFFTQTEGPRLDHFLLGGSFAGQRLTYFEHTHFGYPRLEIGTRSVDPVDPTDPLPWETVGGLPYDNREGVRFATRHELDLPMQIGVVKVVPFVAGEFAHWEEDLFGNDVSRVLGQGGVRASVPMTKINPHAYSSLLNIKGLAHKVIFETEFLAAESDQDAGIFPLYDPLQDDSIEAFQRRFIRLDNGSMLPITFDDRFYAIRSGIQSWVASPTTEMADDLLTVRTGVRQRWQTKRGLPGQEQVIDWILLDVHGTFFPNSSRDNFGDDIGLVDYNFRWHVGDRVTLLSEGFADFFTDGLVKVTVGGFLTRPGRGSIYLGLRSLDGPVNTKAVVTSINYRMSHKWVTQVGSSYDFGDAGNIGQRVQAVRVGESFLVGLGVNVDVSRGNVGANLTLEPRILARSRASRVGGLPIPPVGVAGVE
ncbi:MAG: organic solvent tolerance protein OstA [Pirellulaceae bacterium]|nr:organic solvent tolerance protein OstA [Pirellulaceae bacterium]